MRGSAYVEFAFLAPLLLMACSLLIELATYWDASVMANHAAWTVARIVKVKPDAKDSTLFKVKKLEAAEGSLKETALAGLNKEIGVLNSFGDQRTLAVAMLMSTSSMGYMGTPGGELADLFDTVVTKPLNAVAADTPKMLSDALKEKLPSSGIASGASGILSGLGERLIAGIVTPIINGVAEKLLKPLTKWVSTKLGALGGRINTWIGSGEFSRGKHYARNLQRTYHRLSWAGLTAKTPLVTVTTNNVGTIHFLSSTESLARPKLSSGKPYGLKGQLAYVQVQWPMESDWLFPLFWGGTRNGKGVWAKGHGLCLLEPTLSNEHLRFKDPVAYTPPATNSNDLKALTDDIRCYLRISLFLMEYRNTHEHLKIGGNTSDGSGLFTVHHIEPWKAYAYPGNKNNPSVYKKSWRAALDDASWSGRGNIPPVLKGWLEGYEVREWLYYEGVNDRNYRYRGTLDARRDVLTGNLKSRQEKLNKKAKGALKNLTAKRAAMWKVSDTLDIERAGMSQKAYDALARIGGEWVSGIDRNGFSGIAGRMEAVRACLCSSEGWPKTIVLEQFLIEEAEELSRRVGDTDGASVELDVESLNNLNASDLEGDSKNAKEAMTKEWEKLKRQLNAKRLEINAQAKVVGDAYASTLWRYRRLSSISSTIKKTGGLSLNVSGWDKFVAFFKGKNAKKEARQHCETLRDALRGALENLSDLESSARKLSSALERAMQLEIEYGKLLGLKKTRDMDPSHVGWDDIAGRLGVTDGSTDGKDEAAAPGVYGEKDGQGDRWTRSNGIWK